jgi:hypothetical protein
MKIKLDSGYIEVEVELIDNDVYLKIIKNETGKEVKITEIPKKTKKCRKCKKLNDIQDMQCQHCFTAYP